MSPSRVVKALSFAAVFAIVCLVSDPARAAFSCGNESHQNDCGNPTNIYPCCPNGGNCTWWAWESVCRNWHASLVNWGNANTWATHAKLDPNYDVVGTPTVGSVATSTLGNFGHVAWVTGVSGGTVSVTEENCCTGCGYGERVAHYPLGKFNSGYVIRHVACECSPGQSDSKACACGAQARTCGADCKWGGWDECAGTPEICDDVDNDCNGVVDDGDPPLGKVLPDYAATLVDVSFPQSLGAGVHATVWADFRNDGTKTWPSGGVWLVADGATQKGEAMVDGGAPVIKASALFSAGSWPAWNVAASLSKAVAPGDVARFSFDVIAASPVGTQIQETFELKLPGGNPIRCPESKITPSIWVVPASNAGAGGAGGSGGDASGGSDAEADPGASAGCSVGPMRNGRSSSSHLGVAFALAALAELRRRRRSLSRSGD